MSFINGFSDFWEILTGVIDDNKAKIIRFTCFMLLAIGIGWAAFSYFRAGLLSNTDVNALNQPHYVPEDDGRALKRMADLAQTVQDMRHGGNAIAEAIAIAHSRPFNVSGTPVKEVDSNLALSFDSQPQTTEEEQTEIFVRAIMMAGKTRAAVLDVGDFKGHMVRTGTVLPNGLGRITNITKNKVVIRRDRRNYEYIVEKMETDLERQLAGKNPKPAGAKTSRPGQAQMGVEQFVFEGTVPENSPLTTSVKEEELKK
ncbi:MAG: hypothetical protein IJ859_05140 [Synergistaceae bacterium]|nr:hypothetical protein [Synergistaceae bacterium]